MALLEERNIFLESYIPTGAEAQTLTVLKLFP